MTRRCWQIRASELGSTREASVVAEFDMNSREHETSNHPHLFLD
jgi:hypothetical protein